MSDQPNADIFTKETRLKCDYYDLEQLIDNYYGQEFEIPCDQECGNDTTLEFSVAPEKFMDYEKAQMKEFRESGKGTFMLDTILSDLCNNKVIEAGKYSVRVSW